MSEIEKYTNETMDTEHFLLIGLPLPIQFVFCMTSIFMVHIDLQEEAMCLLHTLIDFFPSSVHRHYDSVSDHS